jgi:hypothetical protein
MKYLFTIGAGGFALLVIVVGMWLSLVKETDAAPGVLTEQMDKLAASWDAKKLLPGSRVVDIIISDAESAADPLTLVEPPSLWGRITARLSRAFGRKPAAAPAESQICQSFADDPGSIRWTHEGFSAVTEEQMTKEIMAAIVKAHDAGAEINIVTQGRAASPALKAIKSLEGQVRGGAPVGVNKGFCLGVNREQLTKLDPPFFANFKKPKNFREWSNLWMGGWPHRMPMEVFAAGRDGEIFDGEDVVRAILGRGLGDPKKLTVDVQELIRAVRMLISSVDEMSNRLDAMEKVAPRNSPRSDMPDVQVPDAASGTPAPGQPDDQAPSSSSAAAQSSLDMIVGGAGDARGGRENPVEQMDLRGGKQRAGDWRCSHLFDTEGECRVQYCPGRCVPEPGTVHYRCVCQSNEQTCGCEPFYERDCAFGCPGKCEVWPFYSDNFKCYCKGLEIDFCVGLTAKKFNGNITGWPKNTKKQADDECKAQYHGSHMCAANDLEQSSHLCPDTWGWIEVYNMENCLEGDHRWSADNPNHTGMLARGTGKKMEKTIVPCSTYHPIQCCSKGKF